MLFFSGVLVSEPLWALIDIYGLTRGVQLLGESRSLLRNEDLLDLSTSSLTDSYFRADSQLDFCPDWLIQAAE